MRIAIIGKLFAPINITSNMGMETFTYNLADLLVKRGHEVTLFASGDSRVDGAKVMPLIKKSYFGLNKKLSKDKKSMGVGYGYGGAEKRGYLKSLFYLRTHKYDFDIIHDNTDEIIGLSSLLVDLPFVSTIHLPFEYLKDLEKTVYKEKLANYYVAISKKQKKMVKNTPVFDVVYNGINSRKFGFSEKSRGYLAWIGRLDPNKGLGAAIEIANKTKTKLRIAGPIQGQKYFDEQIKPKLNKNIKYYGPLTGRKLVRFYKGAKALLFPIRWEEPFGLVMAEAMSCGTPIIAFRRGSVPELVEQHKTGLICPKDNIESMIKAVKKIYSMSDSSYKKMRKNCRKRVEENFTLEKMVENYEKVYQRVIDDWKKKNIVEKKLRVLEITAELTPLAKAGGLGDIAGSLPKALAKEFGTEIRIIMPKYSFIDAEKFPMKIVYKDLQVRMPDGGKKKINVWETLNPGTKIPIYLVDLPEIFSGEKVYPDVVPGRNENFSQFILSKIALELIKVMNWKPNVIHCHDGMMSLVPIFMKRHYLNDSFYSEIASVLTIHNLFYQPKVKNEELEGIGLKRSDFSDKSLNDKESVNLLAQAIIDADMINTVSPTYAKEVLTKEYGAGLDKLLRQNKAKFKGILNGMDYSHFDPRTNEDTPVKYWIDSLDKKTENKLFLQKKLGLTQSADLPLICVVSRLFPQKGVDLIEFVLKDLVDMGAQFVVLGTGHENIEKVFIKAEKEYPESIEAEMKFDAHFAQTIYAGADMILLPSKFEPCGLSQIISMRFGTIPIVRKTGGLADTVRDGYTGFVFKHYDKNAFLWAIHRAVDVYYNQKSNWRKMQIRCMEEDFSWKTSAKKYIQLYNRAIINHKK